MQTTQIQSADGRAGEPDGFHGTHGTVSAYFYHGCRCPECGRAQSEYRRSPRDRTGSLARQCPTTDERKLTEAIAAHWEAHNYGPTLRELCAATGTRSLSVVRYRLTRLRDAGMIDFSDGIARTVRVIGEVPA